MRFSKDMIIADLLEAHPGVMAVLSRHGLPCHRCIVASSESLAEGCAPLALEADAIIAELEALPPLGKRGGPLGAVILMGLALLAGCSDAAEEGFFTRSQAQTLAQQVLEQVVQKGDFDAAVRQCAAPFRFQTRTWDEAAMPVNLRRELAELKPRLAKTDRLEVFSYQDLEAGRWPRGQEVDAARRQEEIQRLGLDPQGFLVRTVAEADRGVLFVLNPKGPRLVIRAIIP